MIEITAEIRALIDKAAAGVELAGDEYIDPADGLIHCKKCGGQRQTVVPCFGKPGYFMPRCICQCQQEAEEQRKAAEERQRRMERIKRRKAQGLQDRYLYDYTFANDNGQNPLMDKARAYVENWKEAYKNNTGLLLFGDVGTGKSFFAGCIANALLDRDVPVLMTNFPTILNRLTGMFSEDRADFIASFNEYDLLIIDDLGVERSTEYAMEQMFFVIDSRYRSRRPMIITTNLKLSELKNSALIWLTAPQDGQVHGSVPSTVASFAKVIVWYKISFFRNFPMIRPPLEYVVFLCAVRNSVTFVYFFPTFGGIAPAEARRPRSSMDESL